MKKTMMAIAALWLTSMSYAETRVRIESVTQLQQLGEVALNSNRPILMMFSSDSCPWCMRVEREFLIPLQRSAEYRDRVLIRTLKMDSSDWIDDFDGRERLASEVADRYKARFAPTLVFMDGHGEPLTDNIIGLSTPEYYGFYLEQALDDSLRLLHR